MLKKIVVLFGLIGIIFVGYPLFNQNSPNSNLDGDEVSESIDPDLESTNNVRSTNYVIKIIHELHSELGVAYKVGSAVIIDQDDTYYYAVTNNHIIQNLDFESHSIKLVDYQNNDYIGTSLVNNQALIYISELYDLHLISFEKGHTLLAIAPIRLSNLTSTELLSAIGYPNGTRTITNGYFIRYFELSTIPFQLLEHSAEIDHGNSGGPLFDTKGRVVGINVSALFDGQNNYLTSYAIPSNKLAEYINLFRLGGDQ